IVVPFIAWQYSVSLRARQQLDAYTKIQELGGKIGWDRDNQWYGVDFSGMSVGDDEVAMLASFPEFTSLNFSHTNMTDAGLAKPPGPLSIKPPRYQGDGRRLEKPRRVKAAAETESGRDLGRGCWPGALGGDAPAAMALAGQDQRHRRRTRTPPRIEDRAHPSSCRKQSHSRGDRGAQARPPRLADQPQT